MCYLAFFSTAIAKLGTNYSRRQVKNGLCFVVSVNEGQLRPVIFEITLSQNSFEHQSSTLNKHWRSKERHMWDTLFLTKRQISVLWLCKWSTVKKKKKLFNSGYTCNIPPYLQEPHLIWFLGERRKCVRLSELIHGTDLSWHLACLNLACSKFNHLCNSRG